MLMPLALIGTAQRAISETTNFVRYSGERRSGAVTTTPMVLKRSRTAGVSMASLETLARRCTIAADVPAGNYERMPILADALMDTRYDGCRVVKLLTGRE